MSRLRDYRFIDRSRLDSLLEQFSSTTTHDSTLAVRGEISVNPSIQAERSIRYREKKDHEKICELIEYLDSTNQLGRRM